MTKIQQWTSIQNDFSQGLVLGNGASIAVSDSFKYGSLYGAAKQAEFLTQETQAVFSSFKSEDFELVLRRLWQATLVNQALKIKGERVGTAYEEVRKSLISTVHSIHPSYVDVKDRFPAMGAFLKGFQTIASMNYDLILYWAAMWNNAHGLGTWFKDAFEPSDGRKCLREDWEAIRKPYGRARGTTLYFYPHGNLCLGTEAEGREVKIGAGAENLLESITEQWKEGSATPLFVSEGTAEQKFTAIRRSNYLSRVYIEVLGSLGETVVFYGLGFWPQDKHLIRRIARCVKKAAVSVHKNDQKFIERASRTLQDVGITTITFFDAESPGAWIHQ